MNMSRITHVANKCGYYAKNDLSKDDLCRSQINHPFWILCFFSNWEIFFLPVNKTNVCFSGPYFASKLGATGKRQREAFFVTKLQSHSYNFVEECSFYVLNVDHVVKFENAIHTMHKRSEICIFLDYKEEGNGVIDSLVANYCPKIAGWRSQLTPEQKC